MTGCGRAWRDVLNRRDALAALAGFCLCAGPSGVHAAERLPDTEITVAKGTRAWLTGPTTRYGHGVLGDAIEAEGIEVETQERRLSYTLGHDAVFEDRRVRLVDIDADGRPEALVVKAYADRGAALALYRIGRNRIEPLAESRPIGRPHRWLNPVGTGRFTGTGETMIAAVVTPHLAGSLRLYRLKGDTLEPVASIDGFTNHIIGSRDLDLARLADVDGDGVPDIVIPSLDRRSLAVISFRDAQPRVLSRHPLLQRIVTLAQPDGTTVVAVLEDRSVVSIALTER
jgi:hypothetical protein